jgi:hypothetical protein
MHTVSLLILLIGAVTAGAAPALADDLQQADAAFAKRMFAGDVPKPKAYACFTRRYDAAHLAAHPRQKVNAMKLLITAEMVPEDKAVDYSFRLGVTFRDRPGDFDSSGDCGHAPTVKVLDAAEAAVPDGIDFECSVDCDGGGISVNLAHNDTALIVKPLQRIRIWKGKDFDEAAATALNAGADDKIFRLDRVKPDECSSLITDRKELAALRHK